MAKEKILVIEDDDDIQELVTYNLVREGYLVTSVTSGENGLESARRVVPHLILLDLMLPGMDGLETCRLLRGDHRTAGIPIVMMTAKGEESDVVTGLEVGADDYITKPFSPKVLVARVRNILRRKTRETSDDTSPVKIHEIVIHPGRHEVLIKGKRLELTFTEFRVLQFLARRPGLGLHPPADRGRGARRRLRGDRALGGRTSRGPAPQAGRPRQIHRDRARRRLSLHGIDHASPARTPPLGGASILLYFSSRLGGPDHGVSRDPRRAPAGGRAVDRRAGRPPALAVLPPAPSAPRPADGRNGRPGRT